MSEMNTANKHTGSVNSNLLLAQTNNQDACDLNCQVQKAIPFAFELGYLTLSVEPAVFKYVSKHWTQQPADGNNVNKWLLRLCYGMKKGSDIEIKQCFECKYSTSDDIITDNRCYNTDMEFLGICSSGSLLEDTDVSILEKLSKTLKCSIFLVKFDWSEALSNIRNLIGLPVIFENVYDIHNDFLVERLISMQISSSPPEDGLVKNHSDLTDWKFYLGFRDIINISLSRFDVDITEAQRMNLNERKMFDINPSFEEYREKFYKMSKDKGWTLVKNFLLPYPEKNYLEMLEKFCNEAGVRLRYIFSIPIDRNQAVICFCEILSLLPRDLGSSIIDSQRAAAFKAFQSFCEKPSETSSFSEEEFHSIERAKDIMERIRRQRMEFNEIQEEDLKIFKNYF